jgi:hypothetical protein
MKIKMANGSELKVLTRREIVDLWEKQPGCILDSYCCPGCRDILSEIDGVYKCDNILCLVGK